MGSPMRCASPIHSTIAVSISSTIPGKNATNAIASLRRRFGMSQRGFAAALGVTISTLSKWKTGNRRPSGSSAKLLAILEQPPETIKA